MTAKGGRDFSVLVNALTEDDDEGNPKVGRFYIQDISRIVKAKKQRDLSLHILKFMREEAFSEKLLKKVKRQKMLQI